MTSGATQFIQLLMATVTAWGLGRAAVLWKPWRAPQLPLAVLTSVTGALLLGHAVEGDPVLERLWNGLLVIGTVSSATLAVSLLILHRRKYFPRAEAAGHPRPIPNPVLPFYQPGPDPLIAAAAVLQNHKLTQWRPPRGEHPTVTFRRHSLMALDPLLAAYRQSGEMKYLERAESLVADWIRHNSAWVFEPPSAFSWGDHSTALRLCRLIGFWNDWYGSSVHHTTLGMAVRRSIVGHAKLLSTPAFYWKRHNHGVDQDIALLQASLFFPDAAEAAAWREIAWDRLWATLHVLVSPRGVLREHSPGYQLSTLNHLSALADLAAYHGDNTHAQRLALLVEKMVRFSAHLIQPDGTLVTLGDTHAGTRALDNPALRRHVGMDRVLAYCSTAGAEGMPPARTSSFAEDGYVFVREANSTNLCAPDAWYLAFVGASHPRRAHKHGDDLSLVLSKGGTSILIDPGAYSYSGDVWRRYFVSRAAHNTVSVEHPDAKATDFPVGDGRTLVHPPQESGPAVVLGGVRAFDGGTHDRAVLWVTGTALIVVDRVGRPEWPSSRQPATLSWHLGADLTAAVSEDREVILIAGASGLPLASARLHHPECETWRIVRGATNPIQGWQSPQCDLKVPADVLIAASANEPAVFVTEFLFGQPMAGVQATQLSSIIVGEVAVLDAGVGVPIHIQGQHFQLMLRPGEAPQFVKHSAGGLSDGRT